MINVTVDIKKTLSGLMEVCQDGKLGYEQASNAVEDGMLRAELLQYSMQRAEFAGDIQAIIYRIGEESHVGEETPDRGTVGGALHRAWINVKSTIFHGGRYEILAECERGDDAAVEAYREVLAHELPVIVRAVIDSQYDDILRVHDRIKSLRDAAKEN